MEMLIDFPGGSRVDAHFGPFTVATDQPPVSGAPTPFALFLASIGTCAGIYVLGFCQQRGLPTEGLRLVQRVHSSPFSGMVENIRIGDPGPARFPGEVLRCADQVRAIVRGQEAPGEPAAFRDHDAGGGRGSEVGRANHVIARS